MNKLIVSDIINIANGNYYLDEDIDKLNINVTGNVKLYLDDIKVNNINLTLEDSSNLTIYKYNQNKINDTKIVVNQTSNSEFNFNEASIKDQDNTLIINNNILKDNNKSNINIRCVSNKNDTKVIINVDIKENTKNNIALEDLKGINNGGFIHIEPNIICSSHDVVANHLTTIGSFNKEMVHYLESKCLSEDAAHELLLKGFIYGNLDDYFKNKYGGE